MTKLHTDSPPGESKPQLRVVHGEQAERMVCHGDVIPRDRLEEARARVLAEAYWAGRNYAMRRSARVAA